MPIINGTEGDDSWMVVNPGTFVIDGLGGNDTLNLGTSLRSSYSITQADDGAVHVDTISGASGEFHATLYHFEKLTFDNGTDTLTLANYFVDTSAPLLLSFSPGNLSTNVSIKTNISVSFNENVLAGIGSIVLRTSDGALVENFDVSSTKQLSISGKTLNIQPTQQLQYGQSYVVEISAGAVKDIKGNLFAGAQTTSFKTAIGEVIVGGAADDVLFSSGGSDSIDGGAGRDIVVMNGKLSGYTVTQQTGSSLVSVKNRTDVEDRLSNVESLKFDDLTVNLQIHANASSAPAASVQRLIELYVAFFNRVPDADGLSYWLGELKAGKSINAVADIFYNAGVQFSTITGFSATMTNADFIHVVYRNVLGRTDGADADGLSYWNQQLIEGKASRGSLVSTILDAAHGFKGNATWGWVADLLDNKITVAKTFAIDLGLGYASPDDAIIQGIAIAAAVTPTDIQAALTLIGVSTTDIHLF